MKLTTILPGVIRRSLNYRILCTLFLIGVLLSCEKDPTALTPLESYRWEISSPRYQGMDPDMLQEAFALAEQKRFIYSMVIVRNGYLVGERYFHGHDLHNAFQVMSVSKSFISALVGLALREGYLDSLDQKMLDFFPEYVQVGLDPDKWHITLAHLLKMRAGFDPAIEDYGVNWWQWVSSDDWIRYIIHWPLRDIPGERFAYITAETHLLSAILAKATGMTTRAFAQKHLFSPLKIVIRDWERDPKGYYIGGMRMYFSARDLARFGYLYLRGGQLDGRQIIPAEWVQESLRPHSVLTGSWGDLQDISYGYQWWVGYLSGKWCYLALGYGGQIILVCPALDLIVVVTSHSNVDKYIADQQEREVISLCNNSIFPAVHGIRTAPAVIKQ